MTEHNSPHQNQLGFQSHWAKHYGGAILNVGCKEDPAGIHKCSDDVTNLDIADKDSYTNVDLTHVHNFVNADFLEWTPDRQYDTLVLGEVLEHCDDQRVREFLSKAYACLKDDGHFIITCPQDNRPKNTQHDPSGLFEIREGITTWHQNYITKEYLTAKLKNAGFVITHYESRMWLEKENVFWHFVVAEKIK